MFREFLAQNGTHLGTFSKKINPLSTPHALNIHQTLIDRNMQ